MNVLLVCRGNTCRSPVAEALARTLCRVPGIEFRSAGVDAFPGMRASREAVRALDTRGIDLRPHLTARLDDISVAWADEIWTMTDDRRAQIVSRFPRAAGKTQRLSPTDSLEDPIGGELEDYLDIASRIETALKARFAARGWL